MCGAHALLAQGAADAATATAMKVPAELHTSTTLDTARGDLLDVHADVRARGHPLPNYAVASFGERLDRHATEPGFTAVLAYANGHPVGYAYGNTIEHGDRY